MKPRKPTVELLLLAGICLLALLPFAGKSIHIDDPLFLWSAEQIRQQPLDYYGFDTNWDGSTRSMSEVMHNPPGFSYLLAGWSALFGRGEPALHTLVFLLAAVAAAGIYRLARELCPRPFEATLIAIFSPVFFVSATTVMSDVAMLCFWVWAVALWIDGVRRGTAPRLAAAALCVTLAIATKYFAMALIPLLTVYAFQRGGTARRALLWLLIPVAWLALFEWHSASLYGQGLISRAASAAGEMRSEGTLISRLVVGFSFVGGNLLMLLLYAGHLWKRRFVAGGAAVFAVLWVVLPMLGKLGDHSLTGDDGTRWGLATQVALFTTAGLSLLALTAVELKRRRDAESTMLGLWTLGTLLYALFLFHWPASRTLLPLAPAVALLIAKRLGPTDAPLWTRWPVVALALLSLTVAWSDHRVAESARTAAGTIMDRLEPERSRVWFMGHWGFQYYMEQRGATAIDWDRSQIAPGDFVVVPTNNTNLRTFDQAMIGQAMTLEQAASSWSATMSRDFGAGFYSGLWGPVPYGFGRVPPNYYQVLRIRGR